jgi:hypothetical protein
MLLAFCPLSLSVHNVPLRFKCPLKNGEKVIKYDMKRLFLVAEKGNEITNFEITRF